MLEQELINIWKSSSKTAQISIETDRLVKEFDVKMTNIQKKIRNRDVREISASVIGMLIFGYLLYEIPFPITKLACTFSIIWFAFVIFKFSKSKNQNTINNLSLSITEQLKHQETTMQQQAILLNSAAYWYSIPSFIINFIFILGLETPAKYNWTNSVAEKVLPLTTNLKIVTLIGLALFYTFTIWVHKRAVTKEIKPLLENIKTMQQLIKNE